MAMQLVSETLIKREIERLENNPELIKDDIDRTWLQMCKRELIVIEHLKINGVNIIGTLDEVNARLDKQAVYFMEPQEFETMRDNAKKYSSIERFVKGGED